MDWNKLLSAYLHTAPELQKLTTESCRSAIHAYTHGLKRLVIKLLGNAYAAMRERSGKHVNLEDVKASYLSIHYASDREHVKTLMEIGTNENQPRKNRDLWCPLREVTLVPNGPKSAALVDQQRALAEALTSASMSASERQDYKTTKRIERLAPIQDKHDRPRRSPPTKDGLLKAARSFADRSKKDK